MDLDALVQDNLADLLDVWRQSRVVEGTDDMVIFVDADADGLPVTAYRRIDALAWDEANYNVPPDVMVQIREPPPVHPGCDAAFWVIVESKRHGFACRRVDVATVH